MSTLEQEEFLFSIFRYILIIIIWNVHLQKTQG